MPIDQRLLRQHRSYRDAAAGITEEFVGLELGGAGTVGVLSRPASGGLGVGFVLCHAFGPEQLHLARADAVLARRLAAVGFPVLRFHGSGYGDSGRSMQDISVSSHVADGEEGARFLREATEVERVGFVGSRLGAAIALRLAEHTAAPLVAVWKAIPNGANYARDLLRSQVVHEIVHGAAGERGRPDRGDAMRELREALERDGRADIKGFPLSRLAYEELDSLDVIPELTSFTGAALVGSVTRGDRPDPAASAVAKHLRDLGARVTEEVIRDRSSAQFGEHHHANLPGGVKRNLLFDVIEQIAALTATWALRAVGAASATPVVSTAREASR